MGQSSLHFSWRRVVIASDSEAIYTLVIANEVKQSIASTYNITNPTNT